MKNKIQRIALFLIFIYMTIECSDQKKEETKNLSQIQSVMTDSTEQSSDKTIYSERPLVTFIELGSVNCVPCKMMQPIMDEIEDEYPDQVKVVFHDVWTDKGRPYAKKYGIKAIPTQIFLDKDGNEYFRHTGFFPKEKLVTVLKQQGVR